MQKALGCSLGIQGGVLSSMGAKMNTGEVTRLFLTKIIGLKRS